jgi:hypothetical protein
MATLGGLRRSCSGVTIAGLGGMVKVIAAVRVVLREARGGGTRAR